MIRNMNPNHIHLTGKDHGQEIDIIQENENQNRNPGVHTEPDQNLAARHTEEGIVQDHDQNPKVQEENTDRGRDQKVHIERKIRKNQVDIKRTKNFAREVPVPVMMKNINQTEKN